MINFKKQKNIYLIFLISFIFSSSPAYAYAGPGVAIGAIIVFITVIFAFFASTLISLYNLFLKSFNSIKNYITKNRSQGKKKK